MKRIQALFSLGILSFTMISGAVLDADSMTTKHEKREISLREGRVEGRVEEASGIFGEVYHSIPYAQKPDHELRFELPRPVQPWNGTLDSSHIVHCYQFAQPGHEARQTTMDCLHIKIVVPLDKNGERYKEPLPVLMWTHGGSYQYLSKSIYNTSGILTAFSSRKVIFVSAAYRLGIFGFLSLLHNDLPGNFALHDLKTAIKFIYSNAHAIGADPKRISIAGESAGAAAASILAVSPLTKDHSIQFIRQIGCERGSVLEMKRCLQQLPLERLRLHDHLFMTETEKNMFELYRMGCSAFTPVEDSFMDDLSLIPHDTQRQGGIEGAVDVPVMVSTTMDERLVATKELVNSEFEKSGRSVLQFLPVIMQEGQPSLAEIVSTMTSHYFKGKAIMDNERFEKLLTISQNGEQYAAAHAEALDYARADETAYVMKMDVHDGNYPTWHGMDIWVLFDCLEMANTSGYANWTYDKWRTLDSFRNKLADIVAEFVKKGSLKNITKFTRNSRVATKISGKEIVTIDADTEDYYFWRQTLPYIESLNNSSTVLTAKTLNCSKPYQIPFYVATTFLIACMVACGFLFSQRKRRLHRDRRALRHLQLG